MRGDREDVSAQQDAVRAARADLAGALARLADEAEIARKAARGKSARIDLDEVHRCARAVATAEEAHDIAVYDLSTAQGADG